MPNSPPHQRLRPMSPPYSTWPTEVGRNTTLNLAYSHPEKILVLPRLCLSTQSAPQRLKLVASFQTRNVESERIQNLPSVLQYLQFEFLIFHPVKSSQI